MTVNGRGMVSGSGENIAMAIVELDDWDKRTTEELSLRRIWILSRSALTSGRCRLSNARTPKCRTHRHRRTPSPPNTTGRTPSQQSPISQGAT